jgi:hypothetical protein
LEDLRRDLCSDVEKPLAEDLDSGVVEVDRVSDELELLDNIEDSVEMLEGRL